MFEGIQKLEGSGERAIEINEQRLKEIENQIAELSRNKYMDFAFNKMKEITD